MKNPMTLFLLLCSILIVSCVRNKCTEDPIVEYTKIPESTKTYVPNKKGETLVFANETGDTLEFLCTDSVHGMALKLEDKHYNATNCYKTYKNYEEIYAFNYSGNNPSIPFIKVNYTAFTMGNPTVNTALEIKISDSIYAYAVLENFIQFPETDSIIVSNKYYKGSLIDHSVLFSKQYGLLWFRDLQFRTWKLVQKK